VSANLRQNPTGAILDSACLVRFGPFDFVAVGWTEHMGVAAALH
jgi:hypothetical protein